MTLTVHSGRARGLTEVDEHGFPYYIEDRMEQEILDVKDNIRGVISLSSVCSCLR